MIGIDIIIANTFKTTRTALCALLLCVALAAAQSNWEPNPYRTLDRWFTLPQGRTMGSTSSIFVAANEHPGGRPLRRELLRRIGSQADSRVRCVRQEAAARTRKEKEGANLASPRPTPKRTH